MVQYLQMQFPEFLIPECMRPASPVLIQLHPQGLIFVLPVQPH